MPNNVVSLHEKPAVSFDLAKIRADFPILSRQVHGKPLVYLDNGASAQKPKLVLDAIAKAYSETYANVHRGVHFLSDASTVAFEKARETARRFVNAAKIEEIIFTKGGTEGINLVASSFGSTLKEGDEIIITEMEHHSNIVPWHFLRERQGVVLRWTPITDDGRFDLDAFSKLLSSKTKLVALTHMSN
ncbi:MAG TPA: aminotransferase class V-fold PLP-dependent enzyme, partial [Methylocella sp.]|nr:aminotransferase class V-fold PLP-dependent enzyme [Methylocella sp.]